MFTGIVEEMAAIKDARAHRLTVERPATFRDIQIGSSIAVAGVCLSVVRLDGRSICFDVVGETWEKTKLGDVKAGDRVNLERAMKVGDRFDGHIVQGHVEGVGTVIEFAQDPPGARITIETPSTLLPFVTEKGSIALDGVALTVATLEGNRCTVALIPHTIENTTLGLLAEGDLVNVETDVLVRSLLTAQSS